ncbi:hypothetical protein A4U88_0591 [Serratia marcescens]|nr:hypothetical protein A4U88_0591 [Serratia marcescens]
MSSIATPEYISRREAPASGEPSVCMFRSLSHDFEWQQNN